MESVKSSLIERLEDLKSDSDSIKDYVINELLEQENIESWLEDLLQHGCISGMTSLVYYKDTCNFYQSFKKDIWELAYEQMQEFGNSNILELIASLNGAKDVGSIENLMAWYGFEETARQIANELELEI